MSHDSDEFRTVNLPPDVVEEIHRQFADDDRNEVIAKLSESLGCLRRKGVEDSRLARYVLILANGNKQQAIHYAEEAVADFRNVIFWVENPEESRLDTPEKIEEFQEMLEWLGLERDAALAQDRQRMLETRDAGTSQKPWWRFW